MRLIVLLPLLALAACNAQPASDDEEITIAANTEAEHSQTTAAPDANLSTVARDDDPGQTRGTLGKCFFGGWSGDKDPKGLNVRAGPSADAAIVGTLPPPTTDKDNDRDWATGFAVLESRNGWFRIGNAYNEGISDRSRKYPEGWIHGSKLGFELQSDLAFAAPDPASAPVVTDWQDKDGAYHRFTFRTPVRCKGHWVQLHVKGHDGVERLAWARGICDVQETTCDGGTYETRGDRLSEDKLPRY